MKTEETHTKKELEVIALILAFSFPKCYVYYFEDLIY